VSQGGTNALAKDGGLGDQAVKGGRNRLVFVVDLHIEEVEHAKETGIGMDIFIEN